MKLDSLRQSIQEKRVLAVAVVVCIIALTAVAVFTTGILTGQSNQERLQQTNRLIIENGTANVTENSTIETVSLTVRRGTRDVNLSTTTIEWLGPNASGNLVFEEKPSETASSERTPDEGHFHATALQDEDGSSPVVNDPTDRFRLVINVSEVSGNRLTAGDTVDVKLITSRHAITRYTITIPESLDGRTTVEV